MRRYLLPAFIIVALVQLAFPGYTVLKHKQNLAYSEPFKFKIQPRDPDDPFRGKYLTLSFANETIQEKNYTTKESVIVGVEKDDEGYARVVVSPRDMTKPYFTASLMYGRLRFPFNKYYINEKDVTRAESLLRAAMLAKKDVFALVRVGLGTATLQDLYIDGVPIRRLLMTK